LSKRKKSGREDAVLRKLRRQRDEKKIARARVLLPDTVGSPVSGSQIVADYGSPRALAELGPLVKGSWSVPPPLAESLRQLGRPVPPKIRGYLLIDTGAHQTCLALDVAEELQLNPVRIAKGYGAGGLHESKVFEVFLEMENHDSFGNVVVVQSHRQAAGIPELGRYLDPAKVKTPDDHPIRLIGLLGREFLLHATLVYRGSRGIVELVLDPDSFPKKP
jgi:hypothetical protein